MANDAVNVTVCSTYHLYGLSGIILIIAVDDRECHDESV